jgi:hypothetical protein
MMSDLFEWDFLKEATNVRKHGVDFDEAKESFADPFGIKLIDPSHSAYEPRFYWIGKSDSGRILTTWYTQRGEKVRIIGSAEFRKFRRLYHARTQTE